MAELYTREANRKRLARDAVYTLNRQVHSRSGRSPIALGDARKEQDSE